MCVYVCALGESSGSMYAQVYARVGVGQSRFSCSSHHPAKEGVCACVWVWVGGWVCVCVCVCAPRARAWCVCVCVHVHVLYPCVRARRLTQKLNPQVPPPSDRRGYRCVRGWGINSIQYSTGAYLCIVCMARVCLCDRACVRGA